MLFFDNKKLNMVWNGEDLKFKFELTAQGFSMSEDTFRLVLKRGEKEVDVLPSEIVVEQGETATDYYLCLQSSRIEEFGPGEIILVAYADVPDGDFPDAIRTEIAKQRLCVIESI